MNTEILGHPGLCHIYCQPRLIPNLHQSMNVWHGYDTRTTCTIKTGIFCQIKRHQTTLGPRNVLCGPHAFSFAKQSNLID